jgi:transposase-like protein
MSGIKKRVKHQNRYSKSLKRKVAKEYLAGRASYAILAEEHELRNKDVVKEFVKWYRRQEEQEPAIEVKEKDLTETEKLSKAELQARIKELEDELQRSALKTEMLETMLDIAEDRFGISIRKKSGAKQ